MSNYIDDIAAKIGALCDMTMEGPRSRRLLRIYAVLCLAKGENTTAEDVHDAWSAWCAEERPDHKALVPFVDLSPDVQRMDVQYQDAITEVAATLREDALRAEGYGKTPVQCVSCGTVYAPAAGHSPATPKCPSCGSRGYAAPEKA
jgi:hypothetical protein